MWHDRKDKKATALLLLLFFRFSAIVVGIEPPTSLPRRKTNGSPVSTMNRRRMAYRGGDQVYTLEPRRTMNCVAFKKRKGR
jgi:hypothetical protein